MDPEQELVRKQIGRMKLVYGGMIVAVLAFTIAAIALGPVQTAEAAGPMPKMLAAMCVSLMVMELIAFFFVRNAIVARVPLEDGKPALANAIQAFFTVRIIGGAMAEGTALLGVIVVILAGPGVNILLVAVPLAALLVQMPTTAKWHAFLDRIRASHVR